MTVLTWDDTGKRLYETGVDRGVLYPLNPATNLYDVGVSWNGLTTVTESPAGADANPSYADNIKYLNLLAAETFGGTVEAYTYPDEFGACDGTFRPYAGVNVGQQARQTFGLYFRTKIGNDQNPDLGFKHHLLYGLLASPSDRAYASINDSPAAVGFSWAVTSQPIAVSGYRPVSQIVIDSTEVTATALSTLTDFLYGTAGTTASLPMPASVLAIFAAALTLATPTVPTYNSSTDIITIPSITGVDYYIDGVKVPSGSFGPITASKVVHARPAVGYKFPDPGVYDYLITFS